MLTGQVFIFVAAIALVVALEMFLKKSQTGRAIRAVAQHRVAAELMGVNVSRIYILSFGLGAACVGLAAVMIAPLYPTSSTIGTYFVLTAFVVVVLGGLGSIPGAFFGALIIGMIDFAFGLLHRFRTTCARRSSSAFPGHSGSPGPRVCSVKKCPFRICPEKTRREHQRHSNPDRREGRTLAGCRSLGVIWPRFWSFPLAVGNAFVACLHHHLPVRGAVLGVEHRRRLCRADVAGTCGLYGIGASYTGVILFNVGVSPRLSMFVARPSPPSWAW